MGYTWVTKVPLSRLMYINFRALFWFTARLGTYTVWQALLPEANVRAGTRLHRDELQHSGSESSRGQ